MSMRHVEVHLLKRTDTELKLARTSGLLEHDEIIICEICNGALVFIYVLLGEDDRKVISCENCIKLALARVMV